MKTLIRYVLVAAIAAFLFQSTASASLHINAANLAADGWVLDTNYWTGTETSQAEINTVIASILASTDPDSELLYEQGTAGPGGDTGALAGSYSATLSPPSDFSAFSITYESAPAIDPGFLLVKDGNATPAWYLFDVSAWDGTSTLSGSNFWVEPSQGAISHVSLYGSVIPEPGTIAVWGLLAVAGYFGLKKYQAKA